MINWFRGMGRFDGRGRGVGERRWNDTLAVFLVTKVSASPFILLFSVTDLLESRYWVYKPTVMIVSSSQGDEISVEVGKAFSITVKILNKVTLNLIVGLP